jgi:FKBP-type peptidyl-prolyl cis-trans isomerase 2
MTLLQLKIDDKLKKAIDKKADAYGVPTSSLVRIVLVKSFLEEEKNDLAPGNIFNAPRDNKGKGLKIDDFIAAL